MQALGEIHDGVDPVTKAVNALQPVEDHTIAEDQFVLLGSWPENTLQSAHWWAHTVLIKTGFLIKPTCTLVAEWRAQQRQIPAAAPGLLCRNPWILGPFQPSYLLLPKNLSVGHKTAGCHWRPPSLSGFQHSPGTGKQDFTWILKIISTNKFFFSHFWMPLNIYLRVIKLFNGWVWV